VNHETIIRDILAYRWAKSKNPRADDGIMGYWRFSDDQKDYLRSNQRAGRFMSWLLRRLPLDSYLQQARMNAWGEGYAKGVGLSGDWPINDDRNPYWKQGQ
jgi:hypothetical protein